MRKFFYGIGLFCTAFLLFFGFYASYHHAAKEETPQFQTTEAENPLRSSYHIKIEEGKVVVCLDDGSIYEKTDIAQETLPLSIQKKIAQGCTLKSEQELYNFLENFSS